MMAAVQDLEEARVFASRLRDLGYELIETGMQGRLFLRRRSKEDAQIYHLHIVEQSTWAMRHERLLRDYLLAHPESVSVYGDLKKRLAKELAEYSLAYTRAKAGFIQDLMDKARAAIGLPPVDVWTD